MLHLPLSISMHLQDCMHSSIILMPFTPTGIIRSQLQVASNKSIIAHESSAALIHFRAPHPSFILHTFHASIHISTARTLLRRIPSHQTQTFPRSYRNWPVHNLPDATTQQKTKPSSEVRVGGFHRPRCCIQTNAIESAKFPDTPTCFLDEIPQDGPDPELYTLGGKVIFEGVKLTRAQTVARSIRISSRETSGTTQVNPFRVGF